MKYCQLIVGPAGSGKSTYCRTIQEHCKTIGRTMFVVNLDPAAEVFDYECAVDIRELISVDDVMEDKELALGPNGGLVYCMEYLVENLEWLHEQLNEAEDDYFLFDCPGQIELYSHLSVMREIVDSLKLWNFSICTTFLLDTTFCLDADKFLAAALTTLSTMVSLETSAINVLTKFDLLNSEDRALVEVFLDGDIKSVLDRPGSSGSSVWDSKHRKLTEAIASVLEDYSLVKFLPLNVEEEDTITELLMVIDNTIQYGEDVDVKDRYPEECDQE
uniref:GPN-loop GTPase 3 n=1 Tax=Ditylenchus dipsaci TaxID=166011 RepID=A0A915D6T3_9BILA